MVSLDPLVFVVSVVSVVFVVLIVCSGFAGALQRAGSRPGRRPNFCWAKSLDQKALSELSDTSAALVSAEAQRLGGESCAARLAEFK
ncbi:MAG: hypothetical protein V4795_19930, partial [Pseudomonadota bacterium]